MKNFLKKITTKKDKEMDADVEAAMDMLQREDGASL